jgi:hypothetical protein
MTSSALATRDDSDDLRVFSLDGFEIAQRMAKSLASSTLVPKIYQGQDGLANCLIALELASRLKVSPMVVMQNMVPIYGRPSWSSQFLIGTVNACGRFSPLRYIFDNEDEPTSCYCEAKDLASGEVLRGEKITIAMAKAQGWWSRKDSKTGAETSKWPTMTGQMLRFRAASWWVRVFCPEISLGLGTQEEAIDVEAVAVAEVPAAAIAPAVPAPLTHRAEEVVEALTPEPEPQAPNSEAPHSSPNLGPSSLTLEATSTSEQPAPATEPGTAQRLPVGRTIVAADPQSAPAPTTAAPAAGRRSAPAPVRRSAPGAAPAADAPIPGLD